MSDERGEMIIHSTGIAFMETSWWELHLKILIQWWEVISRCEVKEVVVVRFTCEARHVFRMLIRARWPVCWQLFPVALLDSWFPSQWHTGSHQQPVNLRMPPKQMGGMKPWTPSFLLGNPHLPGIVLPPGLAILNSSLFSLSTTTVDKAPSGSPGQSGLMQTKSFGSTNLKRGEIKFQVSNSAVTVLVHHSRPKSQCHLLWYFFQFSQAWRHYFCCVNMLLCIPPFSYTPIITMIIWLHTLGTLKVKACKSPFP